MSAADTKRGIETALKSFGAVPLQTAAFDLLEALGYKSQKRLPLVPNTAQTFLAQFGQARPFNAENALVAEWQSVDFLFQLTDDEIKAAAQGNQQFLFDSQGRWNGAAMESYLFFAISLSGAHYTRTQLSGITRAVNRLFDMPAMLLFRHGDTLTLAIINRRLHMRDESKDVLKKVTLIKDIRFANPHRAHIEILFDLSIDALRENHDLANFVQLHAAWQKTLDSSELNKRFFTELANWYFWALKHAKFPKDAPKQDGKDHISVIRLITRLMFCWFVKEKGLIPDSLFDERKLPQILNGFEPGKASSEESVYYKAILQNLFFATLNTEMDKRGWTKEEQNFMAHSLYRFRELFQKPGDALALFKDIPFLNGGLFECLDKDLGEKASPRYQRIDGFSRRPDSQPVVPDFLFFGLEREVDLHNEYGDDKFKRVKVRGLIHTFGHYKFTITENTPIEEEIALDPELSGKVFENLLAAYNPETGATARKQTGSFYTPREIVNYMVDEALIACLRTKMEAPLPSAGDIEARLRHLFAYHNEPHRFTAVEVDTLIAAIDSLKTLDPAVGSGAFPMGILHKLVFVLGRLDPDNTKWREPQRQRAIAETAEAFKIGDRDERERRLNDINEVFEQNASDYGRKLYLIENCIYGVDIQPIAVQIAKMRFFISLVADQKIEDAQPNRGVRPLPNLETKFVAANTLIGINRPGQQLLRNREIDGKEAELRRVRERHFLARNLAQKRKCREQDAKLREEIARLLRGDGWDNATAQKLASWDPYDQNASADFFDAEWMFGVCVGKQVRRGATTMAGNFSALVGDELTPQTVETEGFDVAIANPPYVRHEAIKDFKPLLKAQSYECFEGVADLFVYFYEKSVKLLRTGGVLSFISSNKYYRAGYGEKLRAFLARELTLHQLLDFGDAPVFEAIAYASILIGSRAVPGTNASSRAYTWQPEAPLAEFAEVLGTRGVTISQSELKPDGWRLESPAVFRLLEKLRRAGKPLGEYVNGRFYYGIKTGLNEAFVVDRATRDRLIREHKSSADVLKPFLRGRDVKRWRIDFADHYLIKIESSENKNHPWSAKSERESEKVFAAAYPAIHAHFENHRAALKNRDDQGKYFWELRSCIYWQEFEQPKIVFPDIAQNSEFSWDTKNHYLVNTAYILPTQEKWLLASLNSKVIFWFYSKTSNILQGGFVRFIRQYVEQIPIPAATPEKQKAVERLVDRILTAKARDAGVDVSALEREIDQQVYALYGLTPGEIKIVEEARV
jgi:hypothetical protein